MIRLHGTIRFVALQRDGLRHYAYIRGDDGGDYHCFQEAIIPDSLGLQTFIIGDAVWFTELLHPKGLRAIEVQSLRPDVEDPDYRDDAVVSYLFKNGNSGFATRSGGERIYIRQESVITEGQLKVGGWIRLRPERASPSFCGKDIQIYQEVEEV